MLGGVLAASLAACMPGLDRPEPRADIGREAAVPPDLDEWDSSVSDGTFIDRSRPDKTPDLRLPDIDVGRWYQADSKDCAVFCAGIGRANAASPEQAMCMSGEVRPQSGIDAGIKFTYGCWNGCAAQAAPLDSKSDDKYCYRSNQTKDDDPTDQTVGCFCK